MKPDPNTAVRPRPSRRAEPETSDLADRLRAAVSLGALIVVWSIVLIPSAIWLLWALMFNRQALRPDART